MGNAFMNRFFRPEFRIPLLVLATILIGFIPGAGWAWLVGTAIGIAKIVTDSVRRIREGDYSLDYIAFLAMTVSVVANEHLAGAVVALMITGGEALDAYASARAESSLRSLVERIPKTAPVRAADGSITDRALQDIESGSTIIVRPNELVPLDGTLRSAGALLNEANLTGEALPVSVPKGVFVKSGSVNVGETFELTVEGTFADSTYMRIVHLVDEAKRHQPRVVRLAEKANFPFTALALVLAGGAWAVSGELARALAVLVIATPCPLIIAAPVAFIGGLSRAASSMIIVKRPVTLEVLSRVKTVFFDKTGTLTLGEPTLRSIEILQGPHDETNLLAVASAIEFHSLHPLARAVRAAAARRDAPVLEAREVEETIGSGIEGTVSGSRWRISKATEESEGISLALSENGAVVAHLCFEDVMKENVSELFRTLGMRGMRVEVLTGDRKENAERLLGRLGVPIRANLSPEEKYAAIDAAKREGAVAMVGDGLNDAPALAHADVGIVFSGTENSAAIEAANAVILGRDVRLVGELFDTSERSMRVASESIWGGIALSSVGMIIAALGHIPPVLGALVQEAIDVAVILNSLRAARKPRGVADTSRTDNRGVR